MTSSRRVELPLDRRKRAGVRDSCATQATSISSTARSANDRSSTAAARCTRCSCSRSRSSCGLSAQRTSAVKSGAQRPCTRAPLVEQPSSPASWPAPHQSSGTRQWPGSAPMRPGRGRRIRTGPADARRHVEPMPRQVLTGSHRGAGRPRPGRGNQLRPGLGEGWRFCSSKNHAAIALQGQPRRSCSDHAAACTRGAGCHDIPFCGGREIRAPTASARMVASLLLSPPGAARRLPGSQLEERRIRVDTCRPEYSPIQV